MTTHYRPKKLKGTIKSSVAGKNKEKTSGGYDWNNAEVAFGPKYGNKGKDE